MGWLFPYGSTRASVIEEVSKSWTREDGAYGKCLQKYFRGNTMYMLYEVGAVKDSAPEPEVMRLIVVVLLARDNSSGDWGYKDMGEEMGPCYYDCPLSFLDKCTDPIGGFSAEWRAKVRAHHARKAERKAS
jgi:hypothetical protein